MMTPKQHLQTWPAVLWRWGEIPPVENPLPHLPSTPDSSPRSGRLVPLSRHLSVLTQIHPGRAASPACTPLLCTLHRSHVLTSCMHPLHRAGLRLCALCDALAHAQGPGTCVVLPPCRVSHTRSSSMWPTLEIRPECTDPCPSEHTPCAPCTQANTQCVLRFNRHTRAGHSTWCRPWAFHPITQNMVCCALLDRLSETCLSLTHLLTLHACVTGIRMSSIPPELKESRHSCPVEVPTIIGRTTAWQTHAPEKNTTSCKPPWKPYKLVQMDTDSYSL